MYQFVGYVMSLVLYLTGCLDNGISSSATPQHKIEVKRQPLPDSAKVEIEQREFEIWVTSQTKVMAYVDNDQLIIPNMHYVFQERLKIHTLANPVMLSTLSEYRDACIERQTGRGIVNFLYIAILMNPLDEVSLRFAAVNDAQIRGLDSFKPIKNPAKVKEFSLKVLSIDGNEDVSIHYEKDLKVLERELNARVTNTLAGLVPPVTNVDADLGWARNLWLGNVSGLVCDIVIEKVKLVVEVKAQDGRIFEVEVASIGGD